MGAPKTVQEARKQVQLERLRRKADLKTAKDTEKYAEFYANQPFQKVRALAAEKHRAAVTASNKANEVLAIAEITGDGLEEAQHDAAVAALVAQNARPARRSANLSSSLTGAMK